MKSLILVGLLVAIAMAWLLLREGKQEAPRVDGKDDSARVTTPQEKGTASRRPNRASNDDAHAKHTSTFRRRSRLPGTRSSGEALPPIEKMKRTNLDELTQVRPALVRQLSVGIRKSTTEAAKKCVGAFRERRAKRDGGAGQRIQHTLVLAISSREKQAFVREASGDNGWPTTFDSNLQDCLVAAYKGAEFEADQDYDLQIEWGIAIRADH